MLTTAQIDKKQTSDTIRPDTDESGGTLSRNPSQRQVEKAPEGREVFPVQVLSAEGEVQSAEHSSKFKESM